MISTQTLMNSLSILIATVSVAQAADPACRARSDLVGQCFAVKGDLQLYEGTPSARIRVNSKHKTLGVLSYIDNKNNNETFIAPLSIRHAANFDHSISGTFLVCPLSLAKKGQMQSVCIEEGKIN